MSCCQGCWDRPQPIFFFFFSRVEEPAVGTEIVFLANAAGTSKLQIYSSSDTQASSADPNTVMWPHGLSRAGSCARSTVSFMRSWLPRAIHRACPGSLIRYFRMWILIRGSWGRFSWHWKKNGPQRIFLEEKIYVRCGPL